MNFNKLCCPARRSSLGGGALRVLNAETTMLSPPSPPKSAPDETDNHTRIKPTKLTNKVKSLSNEYKEFNCNAQHVQSISTPSHPDKKRRRASLGEPLRVKTPVKGENKENIHQKALRGSRDKSIKFTKTLSTVKSRTKAATKVKGKVDEVHPESNEETANKEFNEIQFHSSSLSSKSWTVEDFILGKPLGKGKFGLVYNARLKNDGTEHYALKVLFKAPLIAADGIKMLKREVEIQGKLDHRNIVKMLGYV